MIKELVTTLNERPVALECDRWDGHITVMSGIYLDGKEEDLTDSEMDSFKQLQLDYLWSEHG